MNKIDVSKVNLSNLENLKNEKIKRIMDINEEAKIQIKQLSLVFAEITKRKNINIRDAKTEILSEEDKDMLMDIFKDVGISSSCPFCGEEECGNTCSTGIKFKEIVEKIIGKDNF